jgi:titin
MEKYRVSEKSDAPRQPEITEVKKDSISLKWLAPEKDGGSPIFNYVIESKPPRSPKWVPVTDNIQVPDCSFTVKDLTEGFEYEFRVLAENKAGLSKPSSSTGPIITKEPISK